MNNYKTPEQAPKLDQLSRACFNGACNLIALVGDFETALTELTGDERLKHPAVKIIVGQFSFLCGESLGPTEEALAEYREWSGITPE